MDENTWGIIITHDLKQQYASLSSSNQPSQALPCPTNYVLPITSSSSLPTTPTNIPLVNTIFDNCTLVNNIPPADDTSSSSSQHSNENFNKECTCNDYSNGPKHGFDDGSDKDYDDEPDNDYAGNSDY